jgi:hypothetical protein
VHAAREFMEGREGDEGSVLNGVKTEGRGETTSVYAEKLSPQEQ